MKYFTKILALAPLFFSFSLAAGNWELGNQLEKGLTEQNWQKANGFNNPDQELSEWIPGDQSLADFNQMLTITTYDMSKMQRRPKTATEFLAVVKQATYAAYKGAKIKWNVIRQGPYDVIYEWQLDKKFNDRDPFHEISRIVFQGYKIHQLIYTHKGSDFPEGVRDEWIKKLEGK